VPIFIYNSLTREKKPFEPLNPPQVSMYACGPTVYDQPHIGHARSAYIFDVVRRYLAYRGYQVKFVRNVTDVDDKIIDKAKQEFPGEDLISAVKKVSTKYLDSYHQALQQLNINQDDILEPKASEYIPKMIKFIEGLIGRGVAYQAGGDVYFDIAKAKNYGKLSHQSLEKMETGTRVSPQENKLNPLDFALWKSAKEGEPSWDSPWGKGRPGWHIECSVMSSDILGDEFDIHGGGLDLIFPHHENEIAQSEGAGKKFARCWIHHGLLTINGQKMSKSLGNFITVKDFLDKYKNADFLKLLFLSTHYSHPVDFTEEKIREAKEALDRIYIFLDKVNGQLGKDSLKEIKEILEIKARFEAVMDDDFNTPEALASIFDLVKLANKNIKDLDFIRATADTLRGLCHILGLSLERVSEASLFSDEEIDSMILSRKKAKSEKNYKLADDIRKDLEEKGIILEDAKDVTTWRRKL